MFGILENFRFTNFALVFFRKMFTFYRKLFEIINFVLVFQKLFLNIKFCSYFQKDVIVPKCVQIIQKSIRHSTWYSK